MQNAMRHSQILGSGLDEDNRTVYLYGEIEESAMFRTITALDILEKTSGPIVLKLGSEGGDVHWGFAIYDALRCCNNHITVIGTGAVMSMGSLILQAGDLRLLTPKARVMIHDGSMGIDTINTSRLKGLAEEADATTDLAVKVLAQRSGKSEDEIRDMLHREVYMSAEEAVSANLADGVFSYHTGEKKSPWKRTRTRTKSR